FFDIKCRKAGLAPDAAVIVATVRALKYNGGADKKNLSAPDVQKLKAGAVNLIKHIENIKKYNVPAIVAINVFPTDTEEEISALKDICRVQGAAAAVSTVFADGSSGGIELAELVLKALEKQSEFRPLYDDNAGIKEKIETIATEIYGAKGVIFSPEAKLQLKKINKFGFGKFPVCIAKTQYSLSDNPNLLGRPQDFEITVRELKISAGAGFIVALTGDIMTMPGLPKIPAAAGIDIAENGSIKGLF
ncbi:MAG: formate--tetrahydrofolate ligase, partial [Clostridiales bacterium]|nr:formate--tetrahydrofolate ligase [Clostridiales bacterium]